MTSVLTPDIERPKIEYYVNEKKNAIAPKITDKGVGVIQQMVNKTFISESVTVIGDVVLGMSEKDKALNRKLVQDISLDKEKEQVEMYSPNPAHAEIYLRKQRQMNVLYDSVKKLSQDMY